MNSTFTNQIKEHIKRDDIEWIKYHVHSNNLSDDENTNPLHYACACCAIQCIMYFIDIGYNCKEQDDITTPLNYLITNWRGKINQSLTAVIKRLIANGADPNIRDNDCNETAMDCVRTTHPSEINDYFLILYS